MNKNRPEITELRCRIESFVGRKMKTPADFDFLVDMIWERLHENISSTTLKRLWFYVDGAFNTRNSTLDLLSRFIGFRGWDDFLNELNCIGIQSENICTRYIQSQLLYEGDVIEVGWRPNRYCLFRYLGNQRFVVEKALNCNLNTGDIFKCSLFVFGEPLFMDELVHCGSSPVVYVIGDKNGLTLLENVTHREKSAHDLL